MEVLFQSYHKIPFACSYLPGKEKLQLYWIIYLFVFIVYISFMSLLELNLLRNSSNFLVFYGACLVIYSLFRLYQSLFFYKKKKILYEEQPEPVLVGM